MLLGFQFRGIGLHSGIRLSTVYLLPPVLGLAACSILLQVSGEGTSEVKSLSHVRLFVTPWTRAYQAPPSMGFSRQEYWSGVPCLKGGEWSTELNGVKKLDLATGDLGEASVL